MGNRLSDALEASSPERLADFVRLNVFRVNLTLRAEHWLDRLPPKDARERVLATIAVMQDMRSTLIPTIGSLQSAERAYLQAAVEGLDEWLIDPSFLTKETATPLDAADTELVVASAIRIPQQRLERAHYMIGDRVIDRLRDRTLEDLPDETWDEYAYHAGEIAHRLFDDAFTCLHVLLQEALLWPIRYGTSLNVADTMEAAVEVFALLGVGEEEPT